MERLLRIRSWTSCRRLLRVFDDIGFTDISPDDNPGSYEQNESWIANWNMMLMKLVIMRQTAMLNL